MTKFAHILGHVAIVVLTGIVLYAHLVPARYAPVAIAAQGLAQAILALVNHVPVTPPEA